MDGMTAHAPGSNETEDFITDAEGPFRYRFSCTLDDDVSLGKTHHGFCAYYRSLASLGLARDLVTLWRAHRDYGLLITGHSLGACVCVRACTHTHTHTYGHAVVRRRCVCLRT
jgi:hypothetical protein